VLTVTRGTGLPAALAKVRQGNVDAAVQQQGNRLIVHYSVANPTTAGVVSAVFSAIVQQANQAASARPPAVRLTTQQVEARSLKPIQYLTPGLLGWAIASGGAGGSLPAARERPG
jgi:ABC-2 type transport system permease protein